MHWASQIFKGLDVPETKKFVFEGLQIFVTFKFG